jgi:hypothetical protein
VSKAPCSKAGRWPRCWPGPTPWRCATATGEWEILQFLTADLVGDETWVLSGLLRGQAGSDPAMAALTAAGAPVVVLAEGLARGQVAQSERGLPLIWRAARRAGRRAETP